LLYIISLSLQSPADCSDGASGNAVLEATVSEADLLRFQFQNGRIPRPTGGISKQVSTAFKGFGKGGSPAKGGFHGAKRPGLVPFKKHMKQRKANPPTPAQGSDSGSGTMFGNFNSKDFGSYEKGDASADAAALKQVEQQNNAKSVGKFTFAVLNPKQLDKCLTTFFFCTLDCKDVLGPGVPCKVADPRVYSVFVPRQQHADLCVKPRAQHPIQALLKDPEYRKQCVLRPCPCSTYNTWFKSHYRQDYEGGMKEITNLCRDWCSTNSQPAWVINTQQCAVATKRNENSILKGFGAMFGWLGKFFGAAIKAIGKAFSDAGKAVGKAAKAVGKAIGNAGKAVGKAFGKIGGGIRRFFRRW